MLRKLLFLCCLSLLLFIGYVAYTAVTLPNVKTALKTGVSPTQTSQILAQDQSVIMSYGKFHFKPVSYDRISPALVDALIATEDRRFFYHPGIDPIGVTRAMVINVTSGRLREGGSTLTQQLARTVFLSNERSIQRKVKEALLAFKLENELSKEEILELYLNNVYFGEGAYGIGAASDIYFDKAPHELNTQEAALLAGLPQAPSLYNPFVNPTMATKRRNEVLQNLVEAKKKPSEEVKKLQKTKLELNPYGRHISSADKAPYFNRHVIQQALKILDIDEQTFWQQGIRIHTTLDPRAQRIAAKSVNDLTKAYKRTKKKEQVALLSLGQSGEMLAYIGGRDFTQSQYDRVSQAKRQAGSLFKTFVYTTAIEQGMSPLTVYLDTPIAFKTYQDWTPRNFDNKHHGYMNLAQALSKSNNVIAAKLMYDINPQSVVTMAQKMGIQSKLMPNLSLALGSANVSLKEMTTAFSVLSNEGVLVEPFAIDKITDRKNTILYQHKPKQHVVLKRPVRDTAVAMLKGVVSFGTGRGANPARQAAGKTGTSDKFRDAWFIGFTPEATTGIWVGNDDNSSMGKITGGSLPAQIWKSYTKQYLAKRPKKSFQLSYQFPLQEKDFFVYDMNYLSRSERRFHHQQSQPHQPAPQKHRFSFTKEFPLNVKAGYGDNPTTHSFLDQQPHTNPQASGHMMLHYSNENTPVPLPPNQGAPVPHHR